MRKLIILLFCAFHTLFYAQADKNMPKVRFAAETYAFLKGQKSALQRIAIQFPALQPQIEAAEKNSKVLFERAERNIELFLEGELNYSELHLLKNCIDSLLYERLKTPIEKKEYALNFLNKVKDRPRQITDTLLLQGILSFGYGDAPHQEMNDGYIKTFTTKGHPKAKQTAIKIQVPKSWLAEEADMPETVQQFTSYNGKGNEKFLIVIYDLPAEKYNIHLDKKSVSTLISPEAKLFRTDTVTIDGNPGMMVEVEETINNEMKIRMLQFMFVQKQKLYCLQGSIGPVNAGINLELQIKKQEPLFRLIVSKTQIEN